MTEGRLRPAIAVLGLLGVAIAGYLTYVHYADLEPFCVAGGGGCEKVQTSEYADVAGAPVALLGLTGYVLILASLWVPGDAGRLAGAVLALSGFGFSAYLTFRSVYTIEATCQWCIASAIVMTLLAVLTSWRLLAADSGH